jgi:hypothetical protein
MRRIKAVKYKTINYFASFLFLIMLLINPITPSPAQDDIMTFRGYPCGRDCSQHRAGYEWAQRMDITRIADCTGPTNAHLEGCFAWVTAVEDEKVLRKQPNKDTGTIESKETWTSR